MDIYSPKQSQTLSPRFSRTRGGNELGMTSNEKIKRQFEQFNELSTLNNTLISDLETAKQAIKSCKEIYNQKLGELDLISSQIEERSLPYSPIPRVRKVKTNAQTLDEQRKKSKQNTYANLYSKLKCITKSTQTYEKFLNVLNTYQNGDEIIDIFLQELEEEKNDLLEEFLGDSLSDASTTTTDQQSSSISDTSNSESSISLTFFTEAVNHSTSQKKQLVGNHQYSTRTEMSSSSLSNFSSSSSFFTKSKKASLSIYPNKSVVVDDSINDLKSKLERKRSKLDSLKEKSQSLDKEIKLAIKRVDQMKLQDEIDSKTFYQEDIDVATQKSLLNTQMQLHRLESRKNQHEILSSRLQLKYNSALNKAKTLNQTAVPKVLELSQRLLLIQSKIYDAETELSNEKCLLEASKEDYINAVESDDSVKLIDEKGRSLRDQRMLIKWSSLQSRRLPSEVAKYTADNTETVRLLTEKLENLETRALQKEEETQLAIDYQKILKSVVDYWEI